MVADYYILKVNTPWFNRLKEHRFEQQLHRMVAK